MMGNPEAKIETGKRAPWRALGLIAFLCLLAWSDTFTASFQFDDRFSITENERVQTFAIGRIARENPTRALPEISFALNWAISGDATWSYHLLSLVFHIATAWALWWMVLLIFTTQSKTRPQLAKTARALALIVAVAFALHPVQTQAVTYISQRAAVMAALFYILACAFYLRARGDGNARSYVAALICAVAAALSKPNAASLPAAIFLIEFLLKPGRSGSPWYRRIGLVAPFVITPLIIAGLTIAGGHGSAEALASVGAGVTGLPSPGAYALTQVDVVRTYWRLLVFPFGLNLDHDYARATSLFGWPTVASLLLHVAMGVLAVFLIARRRRIEALGILWFYVALSVESSAVPLSDFIMEHRMYLALAGPLLALGAWLGPILMERRFRAVLFVGAVALLGLSWHRNLVWYNPVSLWTDAARKAPGKKRPLYNAANALYDAKRYRDAEPYYLKALELEPEGTVVPESEGLPVRPVALRELGHLYVRTGETTKALATLPRAIMWNPEDAGLLTDLAVTYMRVGQFADAVDPARRAAQLEPGSAKHRVNLGLALLRSGDTAGARKALTEALTQSPGDVRALLYLAEIEETTGNLSEARVLLTRAIEVARSQGAPEAVIRELEGRRQNLATPRR